MTEKYKLNSDPTLFKSFKSIENIDRLDVYITQKIHGTNAQILIEEEIINIHDNFFYTSKPFVNVRPGKTIKKITGIGSRSRWLEYDDDNYGFCNFVLENEDEFLKLPAGRYYGEWCGKGINNG